MYTLHPSRQVDLESCYVGSTCTGDERYRRAATQTASSAARLRCYNTRVSLSNTRRGVRKRRQFPLPHPQSPETGGVMLLPLASSATGLEGAKASTDISTQCIQGHGKETRRPLCATCAERPTGLEGAKTTTKRDTGGAYTGASNDALTPGQPCHHETTRSTKRQQEQQRGPAALPGSALPRPCELSSFQTRAMIQTMLVKFARHTMSRSRETQLQGRPLRCVFIAVHCLSCVGRDGDGSSGTVHESAPGLYILSIKQPLYDNTASIARDPAARRLHRASDRDTWQQR